MGKITIINERNEARFNYENDTVKVEGNRTISIADGTLQGFNGQVTKNNTFIGSVNCYLSGENYRLTLSEVSDENAAEVLAAAQEVKAELTSAE